MSIVENTINNITEEQVKESKMEEKTFRNNGKIIIDDDGNWVKLTDKESKRLCTELADLINFFGDDEEVYPYVEPCAFGINKIVTEWFENKKEMMQKFAQSPFWDEENYRLDFEKGLHKPLDKDVIYDFLDAMKSNFLSGVEEKKLCVFTYHECLDAVSRLSRIIRTIEDEKVAKYVDKSALTDLSKDYAKFIGYRDVYESSCFITNGRAFDLKVYRKAERLKEVINKLRINPSYRLTEELVNFIMGSRNESTGEYDGYMPELEVKVGQKTSRLINKIAKMLGYDKYVYNMTNIPFEKRTLIGTTEDICNGEKCKLPSAVGLKDGDYYTVTESDHGKIYYNNSWGEESIFYVNRGDRLVVIGENWYIENHKYDYNTHFAAVADALVERDFNKRIMISFNLVDYLTQSVGTNWSSCMTIDLNGVAHEDSTGYHGMNSAGILSYALDNVSIIMFGVSENADEEKEKKGYSFYKKEWRQYFHIHKDGNVICQGRMYPYDQSDQGNEMEQNEYMQYRAIMQDLITELWGYTENMWKKSDNRSLYLGTVCGSTHYADYTHYPNPNVTYRKNSETDGIKIMIGHRTVCPSCGNEHSYSDNMFCPSCKQETEERYCWYHEEYERHTEDDWIELNTGDVICRDAYETGDFYRCERCNEIFYDSDDTFTTEDGRHYCCDNCANRDGYWYVEEYGEYIHEDDYTWSNNLDRNISYSDENFKEVIFDEYGNYDFCNREDAVEYNGKEYYIGVCKETEDGLLVPKWLCEEVVSDETGEVIFRVA